MYALFCRPFTKHLKPIFVVDSRLSASQVVLVVKNLPVNAGDIKDASSVPGLGRFPGEGNGNPLQYSYLENPTDRGTQRATVQVIESDTTEVTEQTTCKATRTVSSRKVDFRDKKINNSKRSLSDFLYVCSVGV